MFFLHSLSYFNIWRWPSLLTIARLADGGVVVEEVARQSLLWPRVPDVTVADFGSASDEEIQKRLPGVHPVSFSWRLKSDLVSIFGSEAVAQQWTVLELGSAYGHTTALLSELFHRVFAIDVRIKAHQLAQARAVGTRGNVVWLLIDSYREPWFSLVAANDIHVALVDADHSEWGASADLRACADLPLLRYVVMHDYNFASVRRAVQGLEHKFEIMAALGEARRLPVHERAGGEATPATDNFGEAVLLRRRCDGDKFTTRADFEVSTGLARLLAQDLEITTIMPSDVCKSCIALPPPQKFTELCDANLYVTDAKDMFGPTTIRLRFRCFQDRWGREGLVDVFEPGRNTSRAEWYVEDRPSPPERLHVPRIALQKSWVFLRLLGSRNRGRNYILIPAANQRVFLWVPFGGKESNTLPFLRIALESSAIIRNVQLMAGELAPRGVWEVDAPRNYVFFDGVSPS